MGSKKKKRKTIKFGYNEDTWRSHKVFIIIWPSLLLLANIVFSWIWGFYATCIPFFISLICICYLWCRRWESKNKETEKEKALKLINNQIKEDVSCLYGDEVSIRNLGYHFYRNEKDERCRCVLAYLSNNITIKYDVNEIPSRKKDVCYCEIDLEPKETEERKFVRKISPNFQPLLYLSPRNELKIRILRIYAIGFIVLSVGLIAMNYFKWVPLACLLGYIGVMGVLAYISNKIKWLKLETFFTKRFYNVIRILHFSVPAFHLALILFFSFLIGIGIPCCILYCIEQYTDVILSKSVQYFICFVLSAIILVHHDKFIRNYILILFHHEQKIKKYPFIEVAFNLTQGKNINFLIYLMYFLFLSWTTLARLQNFDSLFSQELIEGAKPAFLVHIAYTNMILRFKDVDLKIDTMMLFMSKAYNIKILQLNLKNWK